MPSNVAWKFEGRLGVVVHGPGNPTNLEWQRFLREAIDAGTASHSRNLVVSYGGRPDGEQRKELAEMLKGRAAPTAIMTNSAVVRAAVTALSFFNRGMRAFAIDDFDGACAYLELSPEERRRVHAWREELTRGLGLGERAAAS